MFLLHITPGLKTDLFLPTLTHLLPWTPVTITGPDRTYLDLFLVGFLNFSVCPVWWTKLATRQLLTAR